MAISLRTFASGDTDYIAKLNQNVSTLTNAINNLETQIGSITGGGAGGNAGSLMSALFNNADALIGPNSYKPSQSGTNLTIAIGGAYIATAFAVGFSFTPIVISFIGKTAGTYYVMVSSSGTAAVDTSAVAGGAMYSVSWNGTGFSGSPVRIAPVFYDTVESEASRDSTALTHVYPTLDARMEGGEVGIAGALSAAVAAMAKATQALNEVTQLRVDMGAAAVFSIRKVGCTVDNSTGVKGTIQIDFEGTIIGWSCIADGVGSVAVEIWKAGSTTPPGVPTIPVVGGKITASAPIALSSAQSASRGTAGVASWNTAVKPWDVLSFNVTSVSGINRATLYIRIQETPPSATVVTQPIPSTVDLGISYGPLVVSN